MKKILLIACSLLGCFSANAQTFQYYDRGPGMDILIDTRGNYRYVLPLDPGRDAGGQYVFDDDDRTPEVWLNLNLETVEVDPEEDENE